MMAIVNATLEVAVPTPMPTARRIGAMLSIRAAAAAALEIVCQIVMERIYLEKGGSVHVEMAATALGRCISLAHQLHQGA